MSDAQTELEEARAEIARLKEKASQLQRRAPTQEEANEAEAKSPVPGVCVVMPGHWQGRRCLGCQVWVWRRREWCDGCQTRHEMQGDL